MWRYLLALEGQVCGSGVCSLTRKDEISLVGFIYFCGVVRLLIFDLSFMKQKVRLIV